jgi:putative tributyrin esterase
MAESESYFRTTETGDIAFPNGTLRLVTVKSPSLSGRGDISIYLPKQVAELKKVPVITLLHGVYGSHWAWALSGKAHLSLQAMIDANDIPPMILAMPSDGLWGDGSAYVAHSGKDFEQWIVEEVPRAVAETTGNALDAPHFIGGLSMGGFGAMRLGARHPERYSAFSGHSSVTKLDELTRLSFVEETLEDYGIGDGNAPTVLGAILENRETLQPFRFDCGVDDTLIEANRTLAAELKRATIDFDYEEFPGGHEWPYWEKYVRKTFAFFAKQL